MTSPDPNAQSGTDPGQSAGGSEGQGTGAADQTGQSAGTTAETAKPNEETVSRSDFDRQREQLRAADQKRVEAEKALRDLVEKDLPEQERLKTRLTELEAENEAAKAELRQARLELAFFKDNKHKWQNPATALKLADLSKVDVDDSGEVRNLTAALDALAKSDPYLLSKDDAEGEKPKGSTGAPSNSGKPSDGNTSVAGLASRVPALRTRGIGIPKQ